MEAKTGLKKSSIGLSATPKLSKLLIAIFVLIFAGSGGYFIWKSLAAGVRPSTNIHVNFETNSTTTPAGYFKDYGKVYQNWGNGYIYGWNAGIAANARERNSTLSPDKRYDTFIITGQNSKWEIALPNGYYRVNLVAGDPENFSAHYQYMLEDKLALDGVPNSSSRWVSANVLVQVSDGNLSLTNGPSASNNKIDFIDITSANPQVTIGANPNPVAYNTASTLSWSAQDVDSCTGQGPVSWAGAKRFNGSQATEKLTTATSYTIICYFNPIGRDRNPSVSASVTVNVNPPPLPTLTFTASPPSLPNNGKTTLTWSTNNVTACVASGQWSGSKGPSGSTTVGPLTGPKEYDYALSCSGPGGTVAQTKKIAVGAGTTAPKPIVSSATTTPNQAIQSNNSSTTGISLSDISVDEITIKSAVISWNSSVSANSAIFFGQDSSYGKTVSDASMITAHKLQVDGLEAGRTYHYLVRSTDAYGNTAESADLTFKTQGATLEVTVNDTKGKVLSDVMVTFNDETATTNSNGQVTFDNLPKGEISGTLAYGDSKTDVKATIASVEAQDQPQKVTFTLQVSKGGSIGKALAIVAGLLILLIGLILLARFIIAKRKGGDDSGYMLGDYTDFSNQNVLPPTDGSTGQDNQPMTFGSGPLFPADYHGTQDQGITSLYPEDEEQGQEPVADQQPAPTIYTPEEQNDDDTPQNA